MVPEIDTQYFLFCVYVCVCYIVCYIYHMEWRINLSLVPGLQTQQHWPHKWTAPSYREVIWSDK